MSKSRYNKKVAFPFLLCTGFPICIKLIIRAIGGLLLFLALFSFVFHIQDDFFSCPRQTNIMGFDEISSFFTEVQFHS